MQRIKSKLENITRKDGTDYHFFKSSVESICEKQDIHLFDYMYFLKKMAFIAILLFCTYLTNFGNNTSGEYLESMDKLTGFESMTLANINGLPVKSRFTIEKDNGMDNANSSKLITTAIDFAATLLFIGLVTLRMRWRVFASDYAVKLVNIKKDYKGDIEKDIKKCFDDKFGKVHEVAIIKDTGDILRNQMILSKLSRQVGDLKHKNQIIGVQNSNKLIKTIKKEEIQKHKLENLVIGNGAAPIKEIYVIFEMPIHKNKWIQNSIEMGEFISKTKDPQKKRFL